MQMIQNDRVTVKEFKGYPLIDYDQGEYNGQKNKSFSFGVKKAVGIVVDFPSLLTFIVEHGSPEQVAVLKAACKGMAQTATDLEKLLPDEAAAPEGEDAANPSFPAGIDEGGNPFA